MKVSSNYNIKSVTFNHRSNNRTLVDEITNIGILFLDLIWPKDKTKNETARKIIIFVTDQSSHYALDGLLGGIVTPAGNNPIQSPHFKAILNQ